jgi:hypothetical protein
MSFQLLGVSELDDKLKDFKDNVVKRIIMKGLNMAAENTAEEARTLAPKATGETEKNIKVSKIKRNRQYFGWKIEVAQADFPDKWYAQFVDLGHAVGKASLAVRFLQRKRQREWAHLADKRHKIPGEHWFEESFENTEEASRSIALGTIKLEIQRELKKMAKRVAKTK